MKYEQGFFLIASGVISVSLFNCLNYDTCLMTYPIAIQFQLDQLQNSMVVET